MLNRKLFVTVSRFSSVALLCLSVLANLIAQPFAQVASAASEKSVRQGLFYDAPTDGTSTSTVASRAKVVILTRGKIGWFKTLRDNGYSGKG